MKNTILFRTFHRLLKQNSFSFRSISFSEAIHKDNPTSINSSNTEHKLDLSFSDYKSSFQNLTTIQVFRGYVVYLLSSSPFLINNSLKLMELFKRIFGHYFYKKVMNMTFYGQFVAGENLTKIEPLLSKLNSLGIRTILDYCVEDDITKEHSESDVEVQKSVDNEYDASSRFLMKQSRTVFYRNEANCERNVEIMQQSILSMSQLKLDNCILAVKMTSLGRPEMLLQLSQVIMQTRNFIAQLLGVKGHKNIIEYKLTEDILLKKLGELGIKDTELFMQNTSKDSSGVVHLFPWYGIVEGSKGLSETFRVPSLKEKRMVRLLTQMSSNEEEMFRNMIRRLNTVISVAKAYKVIVVIDAEQSYFQPAINRITMELMNVYNKESISIMNTYQCYLKNTLDEIHCDLELAKRQGFLFATKLVRGAYMIQERQRAKDLNYKDPINNTFEDTTKMFKDVIKECLQRNKELRDNNKNNQIFILVATHNEDTIRFTLDEMHQFNILPSDKTIGFGQLLGMRDYISYPLVQKGYLVYKYIPYGPIMEVMPYLARRVDENKGTIFQDSKECKMYGKELKRRILRQK